MIAVDTNLLVYAHRQDSEWHEAAYECVRSLAESPAVWAIPWPCIHEFLAITTHAKIYRPPSKLAEVKAQVDAWLASPSLTLLRESDDHWECLSDVVSASNTKGAKVHDARIAAMCIANGVSELWTADRDFSSFAGLNSTNPLVD